MTRHGCDWCNAYQYDMHLTQVGDQCVCDCCMDRLMDNAGQMLTALFAAKDELIWLYEKVYPNDESDNGTTAIIDKVAAVINKAKGTEATT